MVSKASSTKGSIAAIDYIMDKEKQGYELCRNDLIGGNGREILSELREVQAMNTRCKNNTLSIVLSPDNKISYNKDELRDFTLKHLDNLGLSNHQYIAYVHQNTQTPHVHIIANRIDYQGKALNDSYLGYRAQNSAELVAKEYGLSTARERRQELIAERDLNRIQYKEIKSDIFKKHNYSVSESGTFESYIASMRNKGCVIVPTVNKGNRLQGFRIKDIQSGFDFKASDIHKNCSIRNMIEKGISFKDYTMQSEVSQGLLKGIKTINRPVSLISQLNTVAKGIDTAHQVVKILTRGGISY